MSKLIGIQIICKNKKSKMNNNGLYKTNRKELKLKIIDISIAEKDVFNSFEMLSDGMSSEIKVSCTLMKNLPLTRVVLCSLFNVTLNVSY